MQPVPKISVILPFYNAGTTLDRAISSIHGQDFGDYECILIDNNSTDNSSEIAGIWASRDNRFRLVTEKKQGVMYASNRGSELAMGAYITRMDADDWAYPGRLRMQSEFLDMHQEYGAVAGLVEHMGHSENTKGFERYVEWSNSVCSYRDIFNRRFIESPIVNPSVMWRKEIADLHGMYRYGDFPEDYEMWLRWLDSGVKIKKITELVLRWYDSDDRLTRTRSIYSDRAFYEIKSQYLAKWLSVHNPFHPKVTVWGASRISRRRARLLENHGVNISCYIDTKSSRQVGEEIVYYKDTPSPNEAFILTYIKQMNNRSKIRIFLEGRGFVEGINYLMVS